MDEDEGKYGSGVDEDDIEGTDIAFEEEAERAETNAALDKELEHTFPTSDPSSSWAGPDVEPERPEGTPA